MFAWKGCQSMKEAMKIFISSKILTSNKIGIQGRAAKLGLIYVF